VHHHAFEAALCGAAAAIVVGEQKVQRREAFVRSRRVI
jgi:hypothetical protein